jgi:hypothetical protein
MLASTDYEITEAKKGEEAAIAKQRPDLMLTDIQRAKSRPNLRRHNPEGNRDHHRRIVGCLA